MSRDHRSRDHRLKQRLGLLFSLMLGAALLLLPAVSQAATRPDLRQADSPLATPAAEEAPEEEAAPPRPAAPSRAGATLVQSVSSVLQSGQPISVTISGEPDADNLTTFVAYLLSGYSISGSQITVTVGAQPAEWPLALTLPEGVEAVGGYVRRGEYEENVLFVQGDALVETADDQADDQASEAGEGQEAIGDAAAQLVNAMRQSLMAEGYIAPPDGLYGSVPVFLPTTSSMPDLLCDPDGDYIVSLGAIAVYGQPPAARISLSPEQGGDLCSGQPRIEGSPLLTMLPQLTPPADAEVMPYGQGLGGNQVEVDARISTSTLTAADLAEHYEAQLVDAGWENLGRTAAEPVAWSSWSFQDPDGNEWIATFTVVQQGGDATLFVASLSAERAR